MIQSLGRWLWAWRTVKKAEQITAIQRPDLCPECDIVSLINGACTTCGYHVPTKVEQLQKELSRLRDASNRHSSQVARYYQEIRKLNLAVGKHKRRAERYKARVKELELLRRLEETEKRSLSKTSFSDPVKIRQPHWR